MRRNGPEPDNVSRETAGACIEPVIKYRYLPRCMVARGGLGCRGRVLFASAVVQDPGTDRDYKYQKRDPADRIRLRQKPFPSRSVGHLQFPRVRSRNLR